ncbi:E motif [Dillenia turbinata]|uniref:E motif n=1 Tax=Dillenia turbinata TaxID=194707 RepID=A0AAN8ZP97_9MAGN
MIMRQKDFKTLNSILFGQRSITCKNLNFFRHEYQAFDDIPQKNNIASINHSMLASLKRTHGFEALDIFRKQLRLGCANNVNEVSVAIALKACNGDPKSGSQIHGFAIFSGFDSFITVSNSIMNFYCKSCQFDKALDMFESMSYRDTVSWNTILSGFKERVEGISFARRMNSNGVVFDAVTYTTALSFCLDPEETLFGLQLHSRLLKCGLHGEVFVGNALITLYFRSDKVGEAERVFEELSNKDMVSWNAMISGYVQQGGYDLEAILAFLEMVKQVMKLDHVSFTSAISACGHERKLELGRQIHGLTVKTGYENHVSVSNVLISMYSKCDIVGDAKLVFEKMDDRNVISWTTMISVDEENAVLLFNKMRQDEVYPNDVTFIGLIHAISVQSLVEQGLMVHGFCIKTNFCSETNVANSFITMYANFVLTEDMVKIFEKLEDRDIVSWNALISGYSQNERHKEALLTFLSAITESLPNPFSFGSVLSAIGAAEAISIKHGQRCHSYIIKLGLHNDPIVSAALLDMYAKRGSISESTRVFNEMTQRTQVSCTAIISAHARHGDYESVMGLFKEMEREGIKPDSITFLALLTACGRKGMVDMGLEIFDKMVKDHLIEPSQEHYSCIVDMLGRAGRLKEAEEFVNRIPSGPGLSMLQSLLGACKIYGNEDMAKRVSDALIGMEPMESGSYVLMSNLYAEKGQWEKVAKLRKRMRGEGVKKEIGFSWVDVRDVDGSLCMYGFSSGDNSHPQSEEIFRMAQSIGLEMKFLRRERGAVVT